MLHHLIDTNLIIRYLTNDDPKKAGCVEKLLFETSNTYILPDVVVAEIVWVLSSVYTVPKKAIITSIRSLLLVDALICNRDTLTAALAVWEAYAVSFIDAYLTALAQQNTGILYSYDRNFDQIKKLHRKEP